MDRSRPPEGRLSRTERERLRARLVRELPRGYSPWLHLAGPSLVGLGVAALALARLEAARPWELATVPATLLVANAVEWRVHRDLLHRRSRIAPVLYDRHVPAHHRVYVTEDMAMRSTREFRLVLLPAYAIVLLAALLAPIVALLAALGLPNVAALFAATSLAYVVAYEWLHLCYHAPRGSVARRLRVVKALARHHATHHAPELMGRWNFNVTVPLWDRVRGTIWRGAEGYRSPGGRSSPTVT